LTADAPSLLQRGCLTSDMNEKAVAHALVVAIAAEI